MKALKYTLLFFLILGGILAGLSSWTETRVRSMAGQVGGRNRPMAGISAEPKDTIDVLVLGDSESYTSISPPELWKKEGITAYVCGQGGQRVQETYYMLKTALKTQSPKVVVLETNLMFRNPGLFKNISLSLAETLRHYLPIFRYHNLWKSMFDPNYTPNPDYKGFSIRDTVASYEGAEYMKETEDKEEMSEFVQSYLGGIRKLCEENGAKLLFVSAPSPKNYNFKKHNAIQAYADEYKIPYIDMNLAVKELGIDWMKDSQDKGDHLNVYGARKVSAYIGHYLKGNYELEDHRGSEGYDGWDEMAGRYYKELEKRTDLIIDDI